MLTRCGCSLLADHHYHGTCGYLRCTELTKPYLRTEPTPREQSKTPEAFVTHVDEHGKAITDGAGNRMMRDPATGKLYVMAQLRNAE